MISISKFSSSIIEKGRRIIKALELGAKTAYEVSSFGDDSVPINGMTAIYAQTTESGDAIVIGYVNEHQKSSSGEKRLYSLKPDGSESFDIYLKTDGTCELGGNSDHLVKYSPLENAISTKDKLISVELAKIAVVLNGLAPNSYTPTTIRTELSGSKTAHIKTS